MSVRAFTWLRKNAALSSSARVVFRAFGVSDALCNAFRTLGSIETPREKIGADGSDGHTARVPGCHGRRDGAYSDFGAWTVNVLSAPKCTVHSCGRHGLRRLELLRSSRLPDAGSGQPRPSRHQVHERVRGGSCVHANEVCVRHRSLSTSAFRRAEGALDGATFPHRPSTRASHRRVIAESQRLSDGSRWQVALGLEAGVWPQSSWL